MLSSEVGRLNRKMLVFATASRKTFVYALKKQKTKNKKFAFN
jgi:hypothetical protein